MNLKSIAIAALTAIFIFYVILESENQKRIKYEQFLLTSYKQIPNHTEEELENIPNPEHPHIATFKNHFMSRIISNNFSNLPSNQKNQSSVPLKIHRQFSL